MNTMAEERKKADAQVKKAVEAFTRRTTLLLAAGGDLQRLASGLILRTDAGIPFVLTARHALEGEPWRPLRLMVPGLGGREIFDAGLEAEFAPARPKALGNELLDVAIVTLKPELRQQLAPLAASLGSIADDDSINESDATILVGFPTYLAFSRESTPNVTQMSMLTYATFVKDHDKHGRFEVDWRDAIFGPDAPPHPRLEITPGNLMTLGHPRGVSGGGIWRFSHSAKDQLWSPTGNARLIGVPVAYNERFTEYAESVVHWGTWVKETAARLDRDQGTFK